MTYDPYLDGPGADPDHPRGCLPILLLLALVLLSERFTR